MKVLVPLTKLYLRVVLCCDSIVSNKQLIFSFLLPFSHSDLHLKSIALSFHFLNYASVGRTPEAYGQVVVMCVCDACVSIFPCCSILCNGWKVLKSEDWFLLLKHLLLNIVSAGHVQSLWEWSLIRAKRTDDNYKRTTPLWLMMVM